MAGGVALNCVANGRVLREGPFQDIGFSRLPATRAEQSESLWRSGIATWERARGAPEKSGESGIGGWRVESQCPHGLPPYLDGMKGSYLGPQNSVEEIERISANQKI